MAAIPKPWVVTYDPSGDFTGPFTWREICQTAAWGYWPEGIQFRHRHKKQWTATFRGGSLYKNGKRVNLARYIRNIQAEATP